MNVGTLTLTLQLKRRDPCTGIYTLAKPLTMLVTPCCYRWIGALLGQANYLFTRSNTFETVYIDEYVCLSLASDSSETVEVISINLGMVTASYT